MRRQYPQRDRDVDSLTVSELAAIYLRATACSKGFGTVLLRCCWEEALNRNCSKMILWVLEDNEKALCLYRKFGFEHDGTSKYEDRVGANEIRLDIRILN
ncbi:MAG: N-acetyltransferase family protein [Granulosicoccus sp.]